MYSIEAIRQLSPEQYAVYVESLRAAEVVSPETTTVSTSVSELGIRHAGGYIVRGALGNPDTREMQEVFYAEPDISKPKLTASHLMLPVGPHEGPGGQHGAARWLTHELDVPLVKAGPTLRAMPIAPWWAGESGLIRRFSLDESRLTTRTTVDMDWAKTTSFGHHDYYHLRDGEYTGLTINGKSLDELLVADGATDEIMNGKAHLWDGFDGVADVRFPDGTRLGLTAEARVNHDSLQRQLGMLLWRRPDAPYICLEPTIGVRKDRDGNLQTNALALDTGKPRTRAALVHLTVTTELLSRDA